jgi:CubicO group peptidase (beta-lactamase class C family)
MMVHRPQRTPPPPQPLSTATAALAICLALAHLPAPLAGQSAAFEPAAFDDYVHTAMADWDAVGLSVAVVADGRVVFERGYGTRTLDRDAPVDAHTLFAIGSTTKAMTAAAIGMLVDEGAVAWDDPVTDHLPWFRLHDPWATREVNVRDLLTHRAGLPNADFLWYEQDVDTREILERLRLVEPGYSMRSGFVYQNLMYAAAGELIEAVSGLSWEDFIRHRIFQPLGMDRSVATLADTRGVPNVASPHDEVDGAVRVIENAAVDPVPAAGSIWSSAHDMARWVAFLLRGCATEAGDQLLSEATCAELFEPQTLVPPGGFYPTRRLTEPHWMSYGLGWFQHDYEGRKVDFHTGSIDGMVAIAGLIRDEGIGVYVLGNLDHVELRHALMYRVFDLFDADPPRDWSAELLALYDDLAARADSARAAAEAARVEGTAPSLLLDRYVGTYSDPLFGTVVVTWDDEGGSAGEAVGRTGQRSRAGQQDLAGQDPGGRSLRLRYGRLAGPLEHWHYDTFRVRWDTEWRGDALVTFRLGPGGEVASLEVRGMELRREEE